jgi:hypothetical protein
MRDLPRSSVPWLGFGIYHAPEMVNFIRCVVAHHGLGFGVSGKRVRGPATLGLVRDGVADLRSCKAGVSMRKSICLAVGQAGDLCGLSGKRPRGWSGRRSLRFVREGIMRLVRRESASEPAVSLSHRLQLGHLQFLPSGWSGGSRHRSPQCRHSLFHSQQAPTKRTRASSTVLIPAQRKPTCAQSTRKHVQPLQH